ncbi:hypothetical protein [Candidatus Nitrosocosmicus sp. T]
MKNYAKQLSGIFCSGQTFAIASESHKHGLLPTSLNHLDFTGTSGLLTPIIHFEYFNTSNNSLENDSN